MTFWSLLSLSPSCAFGRHRASRMWPTVRWRSPRGGAASFEAAVVGGSVEAPTHRGPIEELSYRMSDPHAIFDSTSQGSLAR